MPQTDTLLKHEIFMENNIRFRSCDVMNCNRIGGVMVSVLASSAVDRGF